MMGKVEVKPLKSRKHYINKDGTVNKVYMRQIWNHVARAMIDSFNGDVDDAILDKRIAEFRKMINDILLAKYIGDDCPHCPNQGWYYIGTHGDPEQCEWCWVNPDSKFTKNNV